MKPRLLVALTLIAIPPGIAGGAAPPSRAPGPFTGAAAVGSWTAPFRLPVIGIHAQVLPTGKVLLFDYPRGHGMNAWRWDPVTEALGDVHLPRRRDLFCAGHSLLPDGRVLITGGTEWHAHDESGTREVDLFDPETGRWSRVEPLAQARWYPSNVTLPDGRVLIFSGQRNEQHLVRSVEVYDPATGRIDRLPRSADRYLDLYPHLFLMPSGSVFYAGPVPLSATLDPATWTWTNMGAPKQNGRWAGATVLLPGLDRVLAIGGTANKRPSATAEIIDLSQPRPEWRFTAPMAQARMNHNAVLLPDRSVFVAGGNQLGDYRKPVRTAELFDPAGETWTTMAAQAAPRAYHSSVVLLPDGRVLSSGMDHGRLERTAEIYSPPYLFRGPRPMIGSAPAALGFGGTFEVATPDADRIARVVLMRPGSATHATDFEQRYVGLSFTAGVGTLAVDAPDLAAVAPPGPYLLFLIDGEGIPSVASWVSLR